MHNIFFSLVSLFFEKKVEGRILEQGERVFELRFGKEIHEFRMDQRMDLRFHIKN